MIPPIKATGKNTATMVSVVARTARPISLVPSSAAVTWIFTHIGMPYDIFPYYNCIINQQTDT
jgi:hypothetical protein